VNRKKLEKLIYCVIFLEVFFVFVFLTFSDQPMPIHKGIFIMWLVSVSSLLSVPLYGRIAGPEKFYHDGKMHVIEVDGKKFLISFTLIAAVYAAIYQCVLFSSGYYN